MKEVERLTEWEWEIKAIILLKEEREKGYVYDIEDMTDEQIVKMILKTRVRRRINRIKRMKKDDRKNN